MGKLWKSLGILIRKPLYQHKQNPMVLCRGNLGNNAEINEDSGRLTYSVWRGIRALSGACLGASCVLLANNMDELSSCPDKLSGVEFKSNL